MNIDVHGMGTSVKFYMYAQNSPCLFSSFRRPPLPPRLGVHGLRLPPRGAGALPVALARRRTDMRLDN